MDNILLKADSYKYTHWKQNPSWVKYKNSYIEARGGEFGYTVLFGVQKALRDLGRISMEDISEAQGVIDAHLGPGIFDRDGWEKIVDTYHGLLPLEIGALPEGGCYPHGTPLVQVRNTDPRFPWLPAFIETQLLRAVWYPSTVATLSRECKKIIRKALVITADDPDGKDCFALHDFGARGVSSGESAGIGGMAHLVNFRGTDTVEALVMARKYYGEPMAGLSIPAAEHSTITSWGTLGEPAFVRQMIHEFGGKGRMLAIVGDSYNIFNFADAVMADAKELILANGCTVVVRPDSGNPAHIVVEVLRSLARTFGAITNSKGFDVLHPSVRVIQGDGIDLYEIDHILGAVAAAKFSTENVAFGMGGALLQKVNRDTCKWAMKTSAAAGMDMNWIDVFKEPYTDPGKTSKRGIQPGIPTVWRNGEFLVKTSLAAIRGRAQLEA